MIVGLVSTWNEGGLAAGAIRSLLPCCDVVRVCDGPLVPLGDKLPAETNRTRLDMFKREQRVIVQRGRWENEHGKRNYMLGQTRRYPAPTWGVYLDADEILLWGEYLPELIDAAVSNAPAGEQTASVPILISEVDSSVGRVHRIIRLDLLERHVLSMSQFEFKTFAGVVTLPLLPVWRPGEPVTHLNRPPMQGEPHIHHRAYYRPAGVERERLHAREVRDFDAMVAQAGIEPGGAGAAIEKDGGPTFGPIELTPDEQAALAQLSPFTRGGLLDMPQRQRNSGGTPRPAPWPWESNKPG